MTEYSPLPLNNERVKEAVERFALSCPEYIRRAENGNIITIKESIPAHRFIHTQPTHRITLLTRDERRISAEVKAKITHTSSAAIVYRLPGETGSHIGYYYGNIRIIQLINDPHKIYALIVK